jgi:SET domain
MFCSEACENIAWSKFHQFECDILDEAIENSEYDLMILKITFETLSLCSGNVEKLKSLLTSVRNVQSAYDYDFSGREKDCEINRLKTLYALKKGSNSEEDQISVNYLLNNNLRLKSFCKSKSQLEFLKEFMLNVMGIVDRNNYIINSLCTFDTTAEYEIGSGMFPFASLINHSCSPNLCRVFVDNKQVYVVRKPILAGEQLFVAYTYVINYPKQHFIDIYFHF